MQEEEVTVLNKWLVAIRPFALPASTMPVLFGTAMAVAIGGLPLNVWLFLAAILAIVSLHSGANMLNDVNDYRKGLDTDPTPGSGAIVRGYFSDQTILRASIVLLCIGSLLGLFLVWKTGMVLLVIGAIGVFIGVFYTAGPLALKYHALGDVAVFLNFGILGALGAWVVQTKSFSWLPVIWAVPMALLVIAILHANNWRDTEGDMKSGIITVASLLGDRGSLLYYGFLVFSPFVIICALMAVPRIVPLSTAPMPLTFFLTGLAFPSAHKLWCKARAKEAPRQPLDFVALDGATAQHNMLFGLLCTAALVVHYLIVAGP